MKCFYALAALLSASLAAPPNGRIGGAQSTGSLEPIALCWPTKQGDTRNRTALLYGHWVQIQTTQKCTRVAGSNEPSDFIE
jgi:hypothetical protein